MSDEEQTWKQLQASQGTEGITQRCATGHSQSAVVILLHPSSEFLQETKWLHLSALSVSRAKAYAGFKAKWLRTVWEWFKLAHRSSDLLWTKRIASAALLRNFNKTYRVFHHFWAIPPNEFLPGHFSQFPCCHFGLALLSLPCRSSGFSNPLPSHPLLRWPSTLFVQLGEVHLATLDLLHSTLLSHIQPCCPTTPQIYLDSSLPSLTKPVLTVHKYTDPVP